MTDSISRKSWTRRASIDLWLKAERHAEADIYEAVVDFLTQQRKDVVAELRKLADKHPEWKDDPQAADRIVDAVYDPREWDEDLRDAIGPALARTIVRGYLSARAVQAGRRRRFPPVWRKDNQFTKRVDDKPDPRRPVNPSAGQGGWADAPLTDEELHEVLSFKLPPNVTRRVHKVVGEVMDKPYWKDVNDTERERMRWSIQEGIEEGKTLSQIAKDIQGDIGSDEVRGRRIATTELTGALNAGHSVQAEEAEEAGVQVAKVWVSIGDDKVREEHEEADGQVVEGANAMFVVDGYETPYPGHPDLPAYLRIGCRCLAQIEMLSSEEKSAWIQHDKIFIDRDYAELARQERVEQFFEAKHGDHDQSSHGNRDGGGEQDTSASAIHSQASAKVETWLTLAAKLPAATLARATGFIRTKYRELEKKYGSAMAKTIIAVGIATFPIPVPGGTMLAVAPLIAGAEIYRRLSGKKGEELESDFDAEKIGREWWDALLIEWEEAEQAEKTDIKGGPGSGNFGHAGRPGEVGGSGEGGTSTDKPDRPPSKEFRVPPPPRGKGGGKAGGFTATGHTNTELGDLAEAATAQLDCRSLLPPGKRQNPLDAKYDDTKYAFEIKAVTTEATEYKAKPKAHEVKEKLAYARKNGYKPAMMIAVVDVKSKEVHCYWKEGIGAYRLTGPKQGWNYMGTVKIGGKKK